MLGFSQTFGNMLRLVGHPGVTQHEVKILTLINHLLQSSFIGDLVLTREQVEKLKICSV